MTTEVREDLEMLRHHAGDPAVQRIASEALDEITRLRQALSRERAWNIERVKCAEMIDGVIRSLPEVSTTTAADALLEEQGNSMATEG